MGNTSRAANGRGLTRTGQRVVARTRAPRATVIAARPRVRSYRPKGAGERERALRHMASATRTRGKTSTRAMTRLLSKIRDSIKDLTAKRLRNK